jgi:hypothetical protein
MTGSDWTIDGSAITVDSTKFYRGKKSLKYSSSSRAYIVNKKLFTGSTKATNNELWGRYWVLAGVSTYPAGHTVFGSLANAANGGDAFHFVGGSRQRLLSQIRLNNADIYSNAGGKEPTTAAPPFPVEADGWQCWEFHVSADDSYAFYINGTEAADMRVTAGKANMGKSNFSPMPIFGQIQLGWESFNGAPAVTGWIDEVAFGPNRITCAM